MQRIAKSDAAPFENVLAAHVQGFGAPLTLLLPPGSSTRFGSKSAHWRHTKPDAPDEAVVGSENCVAAQAVHASGPVSANELVAAE